MHPVRQTIIVRWVMYVLVIAGVAAWLLMQDPRPPEFQASAITRLAPKEIEMPTVEVAETLAESIKLLKGDKPVYSTVQDIQPSLIILYEEEALEEEERKAPLVLSAVFTGPPSKFVIINGVVYQEGERLPDGRVVKSIDREGIIVADGKETERFPWNPKFRVELRRPERDQPRTFRPDVDLEEDVDRPGAGSQQVDLQNLPPDMTPDQALRVLQRLGDSQQQ